MHFTGSGCFCFIDFSYFFLMRNRKLNWFGLNYNIWTNYLTLELIFVHTVCSEKFSREKIFTNFTKEEQFVEKYTMKLKPGSR